MLPGVAGASLRRAIVISEVAFGSEVSVRLQDSSAGRRRYTFQPARNSAPTNTAPRMILIIVIALLPTEGRVKAAEKLVTHNLEAPEERDVYSIESSKMNIKLRRSEIILSKLGFAFSHIRWQSHNGGPRSRFS